VRTGPPQERFQIFAPVPGRICALILGGAAAPEHRRCLGGGEPNLGVVRFEEILRRSPPPRSDVFVLPPPPAASHFGNAFPPPFPRLPWSVRVPLRGGRRVGAVPEILEDVGVCRLPSGIRFRGPG